MSRPCTRRVDVADTRVAGWGDNNFGGWRGIGNSCESQIATYVQGGEHVDAIYVGLWMYLKMEMFSQTEELFGDGRNFPFMTPT